jgi:hypothetical protein
LGLDGVEGTPSSLPTTQRTPIWRRAFQLIGLVQGKHYDGNIGKDLEDSVGGLEIVGVLHFVIHHDQVRMQLLGFTGRLFAILGFAGNFLILTQLEQCLGASRMDSCSLQ